MEENTVNDEEVMQASTQLGEESLPPAGWKREETLKIRQDNLDEEAETLARQMMVGAIPDDMLKIERELAQKMDGLQVSDANHERYVYYWENFTTNSGNKIEKRKMLGWEVVSGKSKEMPEARESITEDGTRKIGDVLLMRCPRERALFLRAQARKESLERRGAMADPEYLSELALENTGGRIIFHTDLTAEHREIAERRAQQKSQQIERAYNVVRAKYKRLGKALETGRAIPTQRFSGVV